MKKVERQVLMVFAGVWCIFLAIVFSAGFKKLSVFTSDALDAKTGTDTNVVNNTIIMETDDAVQTDDYVAFGIYAPRTTTYTIEVFGANGEVRVNTEKATTVEGTEISVSLTEGANILYFTDTDKMSLQWDSENYDLKPINKICLPLSGDVDQSGERTIVDLIRIKKEVLEPDSGNVERVEIADIDRNENVTEEDACFLRKLIAGNAGDEVAQHQALIVDAYVEETGILYDTLADAIEDASAISISNSELVTVTVLNPTDVKLVRNAEYLQNYKKTISIPIVEGAKIELKDDGTKGNGWCRTITRGSNENFKMFAIGENSSLTLTASSELDENSSLIVDGGAIANNGNHIVDVGNTFGAQTAKFTMNAGVRITNNENNGSTSSGGALAIKGTFDMNGGIISGNIAKGTGGAINLLSGSVMNMAGGTITENETEHETSGAGAVNISNGAALVMTDGIISGNKSFESVGNNSVRMGGADSVLKMEGASYIDNICLNASTKTPYIELTGKLTTEDKITLFFVQPLNKTDVVLKRNILYKENDELFQLSERMLPCTLESEVFGEDVCIKSSTEGMGVIEASHVYGNYSFDDATWTVQGVCTDGTYLYAAIEQEEIVGETFNGCKILKVQLGETWETVSVSDVLPTDHSNELTYNPKTGKIYVTHCMSSGEFEETTGITKENGPYTISVVDPGTLKVEEIVTLSDTTAYTGTTGIYAMAYCSANDYYVAGGTGFRFGFLDSTLKETAMPSTGMAGFTGYTSYTKQGVYANDTTIYTNNWNDKEQMNFITMYDWSGNYNGTQYVVDQNGDVFSQETESLFEYNGDMYVACIPNDHNGVDIYKLDGIGKVAGTIDVKDASGTVIDGVYNNLADAIVKANELGTATIVLKENVTIGATQTITGNVTIIDDGTKRNLCRSEGCTNEMFNVAGGAELTFTSTSQDDTNPKLVIDGNKDNIDTTGYAPVVDMNQTDGVLNITPGVILQNNKSWATGGVIFAGLNGSAAKSGGQAIINITGGRFVENEVEYSSSKYLFGGCIYIESGCTLNISNAVFENNTMTQKSTGGMTYGGVIAVRTNASHLYKGANVRLENCIFKNTTVAQKGIGNGGGVLYIGAGNPSDVQIIDCEFTGNSTEGLGGAIYMYNEATPLELSECSFNNNTDVNGTNDIYMATSTKVNVSGDTRAEIDCAGTEQIYITDTLGTESVIKISVPSTASEEATVVTFTNEEIMNACMENKNLVLTNESYVLKCKITADSEYIATLKEVVAKVGEERYVSLEEAIAATANRESDVDNPAVITLVSDIVKVDSVMTIPTGTFVEIVDDGTKRTLQRDSGCTKEMFNVAGGAGLTFTSTSKDDVNPKLVIDGNKENVTTSGYAPVIDLNQTDGILNITPGVIIQNNKSHNTGGVIFAGANSSKSNGGGLATINITGGLFSGNEIENSSQYLFGGCIYIENGCTLNISNAIFDNTVMATTHASGQTYGGVIAARTNKAQQYNAIGANVVLENCIFKNTTVTQSDVVNKNGGGVLYIGDGNPGNVKVADCVFADNTTQGLGGAIYMGNTYNAFIITGCNFSNNTDVNGVNDIYMAASTSVNISDDTQAEIKYAGTQ